MIINLPKGTDLHRLFILIISGLAVLATACDPTVDPSESDIDQTTTTTTTVEAPIPAVIEIPEEQPIPIDPPSPPTTALTPPTTVPIPAPDPPEPDLPPATAIEEAPARAVDEPTGGSPLDVNDGIVLGGVTPDGRPDNGYVDGRHQGRRGISVYVERELSVMGSDIVEWITSWNASRKTTPQYPYIVSAVYVDDCKWRGTGTLTMCGTNDQEMYNLSGKYFVGYAKVKSIDSVRHMTEGNAVLLNLDRLGPNRYPGFAERRVLFHEWGHIIGLSHQFGDPTSSMSYEPHVNSYDIDDINALDRLYAH